MRRVLDGRFAHHIDNRWLVPTVQGPGTVDGNNARYLKTVGTEISVPKGVHTLKHPVAMVPLRPRRRSDDGMIMCMQVLLYGCVVCMYMHGFVYRHVLLRALLLLYLCIVSVYCPLGDNSKSLLLISTHRKQV